MEKNNEDSCLEVCNDEEDFTNCIPIELRKALNQCIECGKCVGICTAARISPTFNSRKIIQKVINHDESVLSDSSLWECFLCHYCWMVCPKEDMNLPELIFRLREISIQRGYAPEKLASLTNWLDKFFEKGKIAGDCDVGEERIKNIKKIAEDSDINTFKKYVKKLEKEDDK